MPCLRFLSCSSWWAPFFETLLSLFFWQELLHMVGAPVFKAAAQKMLLDHLALEARSLAFLSVMGL